MAVWNLGAQYKDLGKEIKELENEIKNSWHKDTTFSTESDNSDIDIEKELSRKIEELKALRLKIEVAIEALPSFERRLMRMRYIQKYNWVKIGMALYYDERNIRRKHRKILEKLDKEEICKIG